MRVPCPLDLPSFHSPTYLRPSGIVIVPCPSGLPCRNSPTYIDPSGKVFVPCPFRTPHPERNGDRNVMEIITATKRFRRFMFGSGSDWLRLTLVPLTQVGFKSDGGENGGRIQGELAAELRLDYGGRTTKRGLAAQLPMVKS